MLAASAYSIVGLATSKHSALVHGNPRWAQPSLASWMHSIQRPMNTLAQVVQIQLANPSRQDLI